MSEYIERNKALEEFEKWIETTGVLPKGTSYYYECRGRIEDVPAADVEPVVHCVNCEHRYFKDMSAYCPYIVGPCSPDAFCSYGKLRRDNCGSGNEGKERLQRMMGEVCSDNRFEVIAKAKRDMLESTNIETRPDEMAVLNNILFRCWQMGWLDRYAEEAEP